MAEENYELPKVWQWEQGNGGKFANINRPTAGARFEKQLPVGKHPLQLYSLATPNGQKVTIMLEELLALGVQEAEYDAWLIKIDGEQFGSGFVDINPNSKIPAMLDRSDETPVRVFESGAILLYLADKFKQLIPTDHAKRTECLNWLFWQMAAAPLLGGGFGHFFAYAPEHFKYPIDRYTMEVKRQLDVLDQQLGKHPYLAGTEYSIADIACFPWYGALALNQIYEGAATFLNIGSYANLGRWAKQIAQRPAVIRGRMVNNLNAPEGKQLAERHSASDFDALLK
ncbi:glutathione-dependent disulfide-bond oxidoreductase [Brackiella oedipodis]|uniref:glutathione-dependent disulfide-bond oxidoreductase n=1 Tax=Brackiella oedipodis TaxID=124225 RepID=UPI000491709B|nr:glutathione-dependent disulfide-bond oxidoreductase [Brackiella oedipodis]